MIKITAMYPNDDGVDFDFDYYVNKHIPLVQELLSPAIKGASVDRGIAGAGGGDAPYVVLGHMLFESVEAFQEVMGSAAERLRDDVPNFTNATPVTQISEVA
jgi:uncharacterized protein (TIGR02118 family)